MWCSHVRSVLGDCGASCDIHRIEYVCTAIVFQACATHFTVTTVSVMRLQRDDTHQGHDVPSGTTSGIVITAPRELHMEAVLQIVHIVLPAFMGYSYRTQVNRSIPRITCASTKRTTYVGRDTYEVTTYHSPTCTTPHVL